MAYEINININGDAEESQMKGMSATASSVTGKDDEIAKNQKRLTKYISSQTIQPFINQVKNAVSQDVGLITGNTELQERINFGFEVVQYGVNTFKNVQSGAILGSTVGIGGGAGAVIAVALTAMNTYMNILSNQLQIDIRKNLENYQLRQTRERAGAAFNRSRSE